MTNLQKLGNYNKVGDVISYQLLRKTVKAKILEIKQDRMYVSIEGLKGKTKIKLY